MPKYFRQRAGVALALGHERDPVIVGFVLESDVDAFRDFRRERVESLTLIIVDVGARCHPDGVDDTVDDTPATGLQALLRR